MREAYNGRQADGEQNCGIKIAASTTALGHAMFKWAKQPGRKFVTVLGLELRDLRGPSEHGLVVAHRADEGWQCVHHAALRLGAGNAAAASQN
jgi:hypothetical protein